MEKKIDRKNKNGIIKKILIPAVLLLVLLFVSVWYVNDYYHAQPDVNEALVSSETVEVTKISEGYRFSGKNNKNAIIFYPGAKVEYIAYAPLLRELAEQGIDCYLIEMPCNLAFWGKNKADDIIREYPYDRYYLAGHSLGGAMAAVYAADHSGKLEGLILLAAYSTEKLPTKDLRALSIYGSEDGVLNKKKYDDMKKNWPADASELCIDGGNHAYYGSYGEQKGDNKAEISRRQQQNMTVDAITNWIAP